MTSLTWTDLDEKAVRYGRVLAADAVQKAGNGHPGTAISLAPAAYLLFQKIMRHDPANPQWLGRDRFVLSIGHSSLTLYTQLFYAGYGLEMQDLKELRTYESQTPGHPEYGWTPGVEMTTGPLGQGLASAVGMAMAARRERGLLDPQAAEGTSPFDHNIFVICGEGDLEEGVTAEACSLAGTQELGNLVVIYDDNQISIEDDTVIAFGEDVLARYEAYGWHTQHVAWRQAGKDYHEDLDALYEAIAAAKAETNRPSIIKLSTIIAWPCPSKQNTGASHGSALGAEELRGLKEAVGIDPDVSFNMPNEVLAYARKQAQDRAAEAHQAWDADFEQWQQDNPENASLLERLLKRQLPAGWEKELPTFEAGASIATRAASGKVLTAMKDVLPELWGGSADLAGSNNTTMAGEPSFLPTERSSNAFKGNPYGRTLHFGIREHAMGSILNGISLHGLTRPYGGTFFVFSDYMRPPVRLAALMEVPSIFVWTHDSVGVGEDGPTHQPIEHLWSYRAIPGLDIVRPADANETAYAWRGILERDKHPAGIVLSRQNLPVLEQDPGNVAGVLRGGYVIADADNVDVVLIATGSEVSVALAAAKLLADDGIGARVVSMPCVEWFMDEDAEYRESVLPASVRARVSVEAGSTFGWRQFIGDDGVAVGIDHYGASASGDFLMKEYGMTPEHVAEAARESLKKVQGN